MKVGIVCPYRMDRPGGVQNQVISMAKFLRSNEHQASILTCGPDIETEIEGMTFLGHSIPIPSNKDVSILNGFATSPRSLKNRLNNERFDILHFHEPYIPFLSWQLLAASECVNVATFHAYPEAFGFFKRLGRTGRKVLFNPLIKRIHQFSAVSPSAASFHWELTKDIEIIPNAIDPDKFMNSPQLNEYRDGKVNILYVGRLTPRKGIFHLLEAFSNLNRHNPGIRLIVVGSGPLKKKVRAFVRKQTKSDIILVGQVSDKDLPSYFTSADIFCSPALLGESFGIVLLEAMASGLPIVAFANAGYKEILKPKPFNDFLVEPGDIQRLSERLDRLIKDEDLREKMGRRGQDEVQNYSWRQVGTEWLNFYNDALNNASALRTPQSADLNLR